MSFITKSTFFKDLEHFKESHSDLRRGGLLNVSMEGPSINWSFYDKLGKEIKNERGMGLLNIGSCGLHVIQGHSRPVPLRLAGSMSFMGIPDRSL